MQVMNITAEIFSKILHCGPGMEISIKLVNWRGVWKKVLSDSWSYVKYSPFLNEWKAIGWENLAVCQMSFGVFFHAPLQFYHMLI